MITVGSLPQSFHFNPKLTLAGGIKAYVNAFGGSKETWYTNQRAQDQYRKYIAAVVSRYKNSNAIFAWELANEPRCKGCNTDVIFKWASEHQSTSAAWTLST